MHSCSVLPGHRAPHPTSAHEVQFPHLLLSICEIKKFYNHLVHNNSTHAHTYSHTNIYMMPNSPQSAFHLHCFIILSTLLLSIFYRLGSGIKRISVICLMSERQWRQVGLEFYFSVLAITVSPAAR